MSTTKFCEGELSVPPMIGSRASTTFSEGLDGAAEHAAIAKRATPPKNLRFSLGKCIEGHRQERDAAWGCQKLSEKGCGSPRQFIGPEGIAFSASAAVSS